MKTQATATISTRIRDLIDLYDGGDARAAADRIGVSPRALRQLLKGGSRIPSTETLEALVRAYDCDATWLLTGQQDLGAAHLAGRELADTTQALYDLSQNLTYRRRQAEHRLAELQERGHTHVA